MPLHGVALLPPVDVITELVALRRAAGDSVRGPVLGMNTAIPHVTLMQGHWSAAAMTRERLTAYATDLGSVDLSLQWTRVHLQPHQWLFACLRAGDELRDVQRRIADDMRPDVAAKPDRDIAAFTAEEQDSHRTYGYRYVGDAWLPHVTIGVLPNLHSRIPQRVTDMFHATFAGRSFTPATLAWYVAGEAGSLQRTVLSQELP